MEGAVIDDAGAGRGWDEVFAGTGGVGGKFGSFCLLGGLSVRTEGVRRENGRVCAVVVEGFMSRWSERRGAGNMRWGESDENCTLCYCW